MTTNPRIDDYLAALTRALRPLAEKDRDDIIAEIRAHLEHRLNENRLDEALKSLGTPSVCARSFMDEMQIDAAVANGGPAKTLGALLTLASRRTTATAGLFFAGMCFLLAVGFALTAIADVVAPENAGLWVYDDHGGFTIGAIDPPPIPPIPPLPGEPGPPREVLGRWIIPVAAGLSIGFLLAGQWLGRFFLRLMRRPPLGD